MGNFGKYELDQQRNSRQKVAKETRWDRIPSGSPGSSVQASVRPSVRPHGGPGTKGPKDYGTTDHGYGTRVQKTEERAQRTRRPLKNRPGEGTGPTKNAEFAKSSVGRVP